jgi:hypothetical protein
LLINFFIFNYYFKKAEEVNLNLSLNQSSLAESNTAKQRIQLKEEKVKNFSDLGSSRSSQIINDIISLIPASILLNELTFNPLEKKIKEEEPIVTLEKTIVISGTTLDNLAFTHWVEKVEQLKRIQKVTIVNFGKDETNATTFSIKITLK